MNFKKLCGSNYSLEERLKEIPLVVSLLYLHLQTTYAYNLNESPICF